MIILVDDNTVMLKVMETVLKQDGYEVETFGDPVAALKFMQKNKPELIVSDIMMPEMTGFEFKKKVSGMYNVPFIFISSLDDEENINQAFDLDADDYIPKPVNPAILKAKVKKLLKNSCVNEVPVFFGDLSKMPFIKIFQFCESHKLTGTLDVQSDDYSAIIYFNGGEIDYNRLENADEVLDYLSELQEGVFKISQKFTDFSELSSAKLESEKPQALSEKPMGMLSGVSVGEKLFQLQTEYTAVPEPMLVTIVVYNGKTVLKTVKSEIAGLSKEEVENLIKIQHRKVEQKLKEKLNEMKKQEQPDSEQTQKEMYNALFDQGLEKYMAKEYKEAYEIWSKVYEQDSDNKTLEINLKILKKKLGID